ARPATPAREWITAGCLLSPADRGRGGVRRPCEMIRPFDFTLAPKKGCTMRKVLLCSLAIVLAGVLNASAAGPELKTEQQKTLYAIGLAVSQSLAPFNFTESELELVKAGLTDGALNKDKKVDLQTYGPKIQEMQQQRLAASAATEKKAGQAFLEKAAAEPGAT